MSWSPERSGIFHVEEHDPFELLKASASVIPYTSRTIDLGGKHYADAAVVDPIGFEELRKLHPHEKIVVVFNGDVDFAWKNVLKNKIEGFFAGMAYGEKFYDLFATAAQRAQRDIELIRQDPSALLVACPSQDLVATRTCDPARLQETYQAGIRAGWAIREFLEY